MLVKSPASPPSDRNYRKELEYLHARKSAIDHLIESLEEYDKFRTAGTENRKRETV
jgi:hypothetical protein